MPTAQSRIDLFVFSVRNVASDFAFCTFVKQVRAHGLYNPTIQLSLIQHPVKFCVMIVDAAL